MPTKKPLKKTRPSAPVDLRTPAEIAVDAGKLFGDWRPI